MQIFLTFYAKSIVFLPQIADCNGDEGDDHLTWRRVPTEYFDAQLEAEIVYRQIDRHNRDITRELPETVDVRARERHVFLQPETGEQRDGENDAKGGDVRGEA